MSSRRHSLVVVGDIHLESGSSSVVESNNGVCTIDWQHGHFVKYVN